MKIGPIRIELAEKKAVNQEELGATGTSCFNGSLTEEEYNADLRGSKGITVYEKMRRSDARVKFALCACELPLRAATWSIEPASDDAQDEEIAKALEQNLFEGMTITWDSFLHHTLLMLPFGFSIFEKVWELVDGQVRYRKLAPRLPKTLFRWYLDENGGLKGIQQYTYKNDQYVFVDIPVEKLLVFSNEKEGSNFEGISVLRTAYKHWYYKDKLYRIDGIAAERHAMGIPKFTHPLNADTSSKANLDDMGAHLYAQEQQYVRLAEGYDMTIEGLSGTIRDIMPSIDHHDKKIAESVLADFIDLGGGDRGSWALSKDKSSFFLMALNSVGANVCDTFNTYAIKPWVDYNYANVWQYPKLTVGNLETRAVQEYAQAIIGLLQSGGITPDIDVENAMRDMLHLPEKQEAEPTQPPAAEQKEKRIFQSADASGFRRELLPAEKCVALREIDTKLDDAEEVIVKAAAAVQKKQVGKLVDVAMKIIEKKQLDRLEDIDVPFKGEMANAIDSVLLELYRYGRSQVKQELDKQTKARMVSAEPIPTDDIDLIKEFLKTRSKANVNILASKLKSAVAFEALRQIRQGVIDRGALEKLLGELSDRELRTAAQYSVSESFNFGRSAEAEMQTGRWDRAQYSAILDDATCEICEPMDGEEWDYDDPRTEKYARGNPDCLGRTRCRCMLIYISSAERRNPAVK